MNKITNTVFLCLMLLLIFLLADSLYEYYSATYYIEDISPEYAIESYAGISDYELLDSYQTSHSKLYLLKIDDKSYIQVLFQKHLIFSGYKAGPPILLTNTKEGAYKVKDAWYEYRYYIKGDKIQVFSKENFFARNKLTIYTMIMLTIITIFRSRDRIFKKNKNHMGNEVETMIE